jgi:hypothetical protein
LTDTEQLPLFNVQLPSDVVPRVKLTEPLGLNDAVMLSVTVTVTVVDPDARVAGLAEADTEVAS